ncbi:MAG: redox-regulated ATPase YchF [Chloroflexi bacterium]|nr:MAG: redox-regulated ATPase YchF [Chloroflexota bacterium]
MNVVSAITGLPYVGKTTLFNLLTGAHASTGAFAGAEAETNVGVAKVPDQRVEELAALYKPKKITHAEIMYRDIGLARAEKPGQAISPQKLGDLRTADAIVHVVRAFSAPSVPHVDGSVDPVRSKGPEREMKEREKAVLRRAIAALAEERPLRDLDLDPDEEKAIRGFRFLTRMPVLVAVNLDEDDVAEPERVIAPVREAAKAHRASVVVPVSAKLEAEIAELPPDEAASFRRDLGLAEPALDRLIRATYELLGLCSFFTVGEDEVRAWTVPYGAPAQQAAGAIHTDLERGFIRAEVIGWQELLKAGSEANAKKLGVMRTEGKTYPVKDGEILHVLFNV